MKKICISKEWFFLGAKGYEPCDLPHDYQIKQTRIPDGSPQNGYFPDRMGRYIKYLALDSDKHYLLDIDGAYMCARVYFNEELLTMHPYGYTPFLLDLTPHVLGGQTNKLGVTLSPLQRSSRWYTGNGIYRDVFLWVGGSVRIEPRDIFISTLRTEETFATVKVKYTVSSDMQANIKVCFTVDKDNKVTKEHYVKKGKNYFETVLEIANAKLWDIESPNLYTLKTSIILGDIITDQTETDFGIRTFCADAKNGLTLNGRPLKLKGGCIHHDHGELGAAAFPAAEERKIKKLKAAGFNAVRTAHNPPSLALLEACDRLGMIVMDEAFDMWNLPKNPNDYSLFFADWWSRDIAAMVLRDRNHPCVLSYSIGNEINEINGTSNSAEISQMLADEVRKYDDTRFVTAALCKPFAKDTSFEISELDPEDYTDFIKRRFSDMDAVGINKATEEFWKPLDIVGVNYYFENYRLDVEAYPDILLWGSETKTSTFFDSWSEALKYPNLLGDFTWTAMDNLGEAGAGRAVWARETDCQAERIPLYGVEYPWRNCYQGDFDLCGFRRPQSYYREAIWNENAPLRIFTTHPEHFGEKYLGTGWHFRGVSQSWSFEDRYVGRPVKAEVYTSADKVVWYINDEMAGESIPHKNIAELETFYQKGRIRAVVVKDGKTISEAVLTTAEKPSRIIATPEKEHIVADGRDLCYIPVMVADVNNVWITDDKRELTCRVYGGELLAFFSGDPMSEDDVNSGSCHTFEGRALAVIRAKTVGEMLVTFSGEGIAGETVRITKREINEKL